MAHALILTSDALSVLQNSRSMPLVAALAVRLAACVTTWAMRRRTRATLAQLEPWQLRDVGLSHRQAEIEARRAFWER